MLTKEFLEFEYLNNKKPMHQIAKESGVAIGSVFNYIKKYKIPTRKAINEETKKKISIAQKGKISPLKGKKLSNETKEKLSNSKKGKFIKPSFFGGHKKKRKDGYICVYTPNHPNATNDGYVMEHILMMEKHIGRYLKKEEVVHHKNSIRDDNRIENLQLMTFKEHASYHMKKRMIEKYKKERNDYY